MNAKMKRLDGTVQVSTPKQPERGVPENIEIARKGSKVILTIDTAKRLRPSSTGKSILIATTNGFAKLDDNTWLSLTAGTKE